MLHSKVDIEINFSSLSHEDSAAELAKIVTAIEQHVGREVQRASVYTYNDGFPEDAYA